MNILSRYSGGFKTWVHTRLSIYYVLPLLMAFSILPASRSLSQPCNAQDSRIAIRLYETDSLYNFVDVSDVFLEGWDSLSQIVFWQEIIEMDSLDALISTANGRKILGRLSSEYYECLNDEERQLYKDSVKKELGYKSSDKLYVTYGKNHYYRFHAVLPQITAATDIFMQQGLNPWYSQAILLIESPARLRESPAGAYGPYQLLKGVGRAYGLTIRDSIDQRSDIVLASTAAAKFIKNSCIPEARQILANRGIRVKGDPLWFRLFVLHVYHAGARTVSRVVRRMPRIKADQSFIRKLWKSSYGRFGNASQNYSQIALATLIKLEQTIANDYEYVCE